MFQKHQPTNVLSIEHGKIRHRDIGILLSRTPINIYRFIIFLEHVLLTAVKCSLAAHVTLTSFNTVIQYGCFFCRTL